MSAFPEITADAVHVWEVALRVGRDEIDRYHSVLDAEERAKAARFLEERARVQYVVSRGAIRHALAHYTGTPAKSLRFTVVADGKPALAEPNPGGFTFNSSHSGEVGLLGVAVNREVGIDVEQVREIPKALELARRFFSPEEFRQVADTPDGERARAFLEIWVRREAGTKAIGASVWRGLASWKPRGLSDDIGLPASQDHAEPAAPPTDAEKLNNHSLNIGTDYVAAVVARGGDWRVVRCGTLTVP